MNEGFAYIVGQTYRTQAGDYVKVLGRAGLDTPGCESLKCSDGLHRYDRSTRSEDAGRVTGTARDYSYPHNFTRALTLYEWACSSCEWTGHSGLRMLGSIGTLCPECGDVLE